MPLFGRHDNQRTERTAEDRERARRERAARRAARQGLEPPPENGLGPEADPTGAPPVEPTPATPAGEPVAWGPEPVPEVPAPEPEPEPEPASEPEPEPEPTPEPAAQEPDREPAAPQQDPARRAQEPGETREFTAADEAEALGRRRPASEPDATREFSAGEIADARGQSRPAADPDDLDIAWQDAARSGEPRPDRPLRRIQPEPAPPPPAPAGTLPDTEPPPQSARAARRSRRRRGGAVMTPPGDVPRGPRRRGRRGPARIAALLAIIVVLAVLLWLLNAFLQPFAGEGSGSVTVVIPEGASAGKIGDVLADAGVVDSGFIFSVRASLSGSRDDLQSGRHVLKHDMSYSAAIEALSRKPTSSMSPVIHVAIPEGRTRREIRDIAKKEGLTGNYLAATEKAPDGFSLRRYGAPRDRTLEGFLFPATYDVEAGASAAALVDKQLDAFRSNFAKVDMTKARRRNLTPYDVLIIASMVEREARVAKERPLIAAVIQNRLREDLPLGIDATIRYATNNWTRPLTQSELQRDSPFNTRMHRGLPPTPIGNPGLASIKAAANPSSRDYLYYVVKPGTCGEHAFSRSEEQFQRDVDRYNAARRAAGGKSPTKC